MWEKLTMPPWKYMEKVQGIQCKVKYATFGLKGKKDKFD